MTRLIDLVMQVLEDSPGGVGSIRLKQEVEQLTGQRFNLQLWDEWLRKLGREGVIGFCDFGNGGVCHHPRDPLCRVDGVSILAERFEEAKS